MDSGFESLEVVHIDNGIADALRSQRVGNQVVRATVEVVGSHDMVAILHDILQGIGDGSGTRGHGQSGYTTLEGCDTVFEHTLRRVGQSTVDVTGIAETETVGSVLGIVEHITRGLVDRHGSCVGCGVCLFLAYMKLQCLKLVILLCTHNLILSIF